MVTTSVFGAGEVHDGLSGPGEQELHTSERFVRPKLYGRERRIPAGAVHWPRADVVRHRVSRAHVAHVTHHAPSPPNPEPS